MGSNPIGGFRGRSSIGRVYVLHAYGYRFNSGRLQKLFGTMLLHCLLLLPFLSAVILSLVSSKTKNIRLIKMLGFFLSNLIFFVSLLLWVFFDQSSIEFQFITTFLWLPFLDSVFGVDGLSLFFILLTTGLIPLCFLASWSSLKGFWSEYLISFFVIEGFLLLVFSTLDVLVFYVCFESILAPMFFVIGVWGSRTRKTRAGYLFFLYTLFGSVILLFGIIYIYSYYGTLYYPILLENPLLPTVQNFLWFAFAFAFATKVPVYPFHIWLPEAHVEAPTSGSVLLAGVLLKMGIYGFLRFSLFLFPYASEFFLPLIYTFTLVGMLYTSIIAIRQTDLKRIIAYASVAHMNLVLAGLCSLNSIGIAGAIIQSLSHGLISSSLFLGVGVLYDRYHTRLVKYYSGLITVMPFFCIFLFLFILGNLGFPGLSSFVGEILLLTGIYNVNPTVAFFSALGMILGAIYSLWLFNRIAFGNLKTQYIHAFTDLCFNEFCVFFPMGLGVLVMGLYPEPFFNAIQFSVAYTTLFFF